MSEACLEQIRSTPLTVGDLFENSDIVHGWEDAEVQMGMNWSGSRGTESHFDAGADLGIVLALTVGRSRTWGYNRRFVEEQGKFAWEMIPMTGTLSVLELGEGVCKKAPELGFSVLHRGPKCPEDEFRCFIRINGYHKRVTKVVYGSTRL